MAITNRAPKAMAGTAYNRQAAELLRAARVRARCSQIDFSFLFSELFGFDVSPSSVSYWESATNDLPAAVLLAAVALSGQRIQVRRANVRELWKAIAARYNAKPDNSTQI